MISFPGAFLFNSNTVEELCFEAHVGEEGLSGSGVTIRTEVPGNGWTNTKLAL